MTSTLDRRPIHERLNDFYPDAEVLVMIRTPQEALGDQTPGELILAGRADEVHALIDRLQAGLTKERV